jgi:hypothetical protein
MKEVDKDNVRLPMMNQDYQNAAVCSRASKYVEVVLVALIRVFCGCRPSSTPRLPSYELHHRARLCLLLAFDIPSHLGVDLKSRRPYLMKSPAHSIPKLINLFTCQVAVTEDSQCAT